MNRGILFSLPSSFFGWGTPYHSDSSPLADRESGKPSTVVAPPSGHPKPLVARQRSHCNSFRTFFLHILSTKGLFCFLQNMGMSHECWFPCIGSTQVLAVIIGLNEPLLLRTLPVSRPNGGSACSFWVIIFLTFPSAFIFLIG